MISAARERELLESAKPRLMAMAKRIARRFNPDLHDDIFQAAWVKASTLVPTHDPARGEFATYVLRPCLGAAIEALTSEIGAEKVKQLVARAAAISELAEAVPTADPMMETLPEMARRFESAKRAATGALLIGLVAPLRPDEAYLRAEETARAESVLRGCLAALPPQHQETLQRHLVGGESFRDIFASRGESYLAAWRGFHGAMEALGAELVARGVGPETARSVVRQATVLE